MKPRAHRPLPRGLTMLELAIVLAVLAVLVSLAVPSMGARLDRQRVHATAEALVADLAEARFEAARLGKPLFLQTQAGAQWCWAVATTQGCDCSAPASCQLHSARATNHRGVRLIGDLALQLDPVGTPMAAQAAALETPRGERLRVDVSPLGRARICAEKGSWPQTPTC